MEAGELMRIYDESMEPIGFPDLSMGWLENSTFTVHHEAVEGVKEEFHYETIREYPNGGKDVRKVIDVPGVTAQAAWDEEIQIQIYHPYTQEELEAIEAERNKPTYDQRLEAMEEMIDMLLAGVTSDE